MSGRRRTTAESGACSDCTLFINCGSVAACVCVCVCPIIVKLQTLTVRRHSQCTSRWDIIHCCRSCQPLHITLCHLPPLPTSQIVGLKHLLHPLLPSLTAVLVECLLYSQLLYFSQLRVEQLERVLLCPGSQCPPQLELPQLSSGQR